MSITTIMAIGPKIKDSYKHRVIRCTPAQAERVVKENLIDVAVIDINESTCDVLKFHDKFPIIGICNSHRPNEKIFRYLTPAELNTPVFEMVIASAIAGHGARLQDSIFRQQIQLSAIFKAIPDALVFCNGDDPAHVVKLVNLAFTRIFGWTQEETKNRVPSYIFAETKFYVELMNRVDRLADFETITERGIEMVRRDGGKIIADVMIVKVPEIEPFGFLMVITDKTQQQRQLDRLMFLKKAVERISEPVIILDETGLIHWANSATNPTGVKVETKHPVDVGIFDDDTFWQMWKIVNSGNEYNKDGIYATKQNNMVLVIVTGK